MILFAWRDEMMKGRIKLREWYEGRDELEISSKLFGRIERKDKNGSFSCLLLFGIGKK